MFLDNHNRKYHLSTEDGILSLFTGLSGISYSERHWELSKRCQSKKHVWGHRTIAVLEAIPVIGCISALFERIAFFIKETCFNNRPSDTDSQSLKEKLIQYDHKLQENNTAKTWNPRALGLNKAAQKMWKNSRKAIEEHIPKDLTSYATSTEALPPIETMINFKPSNSLTFQHFFDETQGIRPTMEDAHFFQETDQGIITGVLDGHGGDKVAQYASRVFNQNFFKLLKKSAGNVHQTFEFLIDEIHNQIEEKPEWDKMGTTAVICFIDKRSHCIYTATLGDSEANIYRRINNQVKSIPLSCVRDWSSKKDALRASIALNNPKIAKEWPLASRPKYLRYGGINVSRAIGDVNLRGTSEKPGVIHKPKITINQVQSGDILVLGCDGLKDFVPENEIITILKTENSPRKLVDHAFYVRRSTDNVTVLTINIH